MCYLYRESAASGLTTTSIIKTRIFFFLYLLVLLLSNLLITLLGEAFSRKKSEIESLDRKLWIK